MTVQERIAMALRDVAHQVEAGEFDASDEDTLPKDEVDQIVSEAVSDLESASSDLQYFGSTAIEDAERAASDVQDLIDNAISKLSELQQ